MKRLLCLLLTALMLLTGLSAQADGPRSAWPERLRFRLQDAPEETVRQKVYTRLTTVFTADPVVNALLADVGEAMMAEARQHLPTDAVVRDRSYARVWPVVRRTGDRTLSVLTQGLVHHNYEQLWSAADARVFDMMNGQQVRLPELFDSGSKGWQLMLERTGLEEISDLKALPFILTGGSLRLLLPQRYPWRQEWVTLFYPEIRPLMNDYGQLLTDPGDHPMAALTFDDGPAHQYSLRTMNTLRRYGADATFFLVGSMIPQGHYVILAANDSGHSLAYHTFDHVTEGKRNVAEEWQRFCELFEPLTGYRPSLIRAPGGEELPYIQANFQLPLIHWNANADDGIENANYDEAKQEEIARRISRNARDGMVLLCHDLRPVCYRYIDKALEAMEAKGFLYLTVEELYAMKGETLEPLTVYWGPGEPTGIRN